MTHTAPARCGAWLHRIGELSRRCTGPRGHDPEVEPHASEDGWRWAPGRPAWREPQP
jgi:hypothetical protein